MQGLSTTSQRPRRVPPQGPLRRFLGQVCGQTYSIWPRTQLPQASQPKSGRLTANSMPSVACARDGWRSIQRKREVRRERSLVGAEESLTGESSAKASSTLGTNGREVGAGEESVARCAATTDDA